MLNIIKPVPLEGISKVNWQEWAVKSLGIIVFFSLLEFALFSFSVKFSLYEGWVSWYFPVGLRVVLFLLLPFRYWPALYLANEWGQGLYFVTFWENEQIYNFNGSYIDYFLSRAFRPVDLTYTQHWALFPIALLKYKFNDLDFTKLRPFIYILVACSSYRAFASVKLIFTSHLYQQIPDERKFEMVLGHFLGGFVGITTMMLAIFFVFRSWQCRHMISLPKVNNCVIQLIALVIFVLALYQLQPHTLYLMRIIAIIPLVYFLVKFGWFGITTCAFTMNCLLFTYLFGLNQTDMLVENQIYVISYALSALLLGALYQEQQSDQQKLAQSNEKLAESNIELTELSTKVQALAQQLVSTQEKERHYLSQELHDEVGQNISALKIELKVLQTRLEKQNVALSTEQLGKVSNHIYDSVYSVLNWLRPRVLDDIGLYECLTGSYFKGRLEKSGIDYQTTIEKDINQLDDNLKIAIFRITQEAITNTLRYANARLFIVKCQITTNDIELTIIDDGVGFQSNELKNQSGGFGLSGIEGRVLALQGKIKVLSVPDIGTKIAITWPKNNGVSISKPT